MGIRTPLQKYESENINLEVTTRKVPPDFLCVSPLFEPVTANPRIAGNTYRWWCSDDALDLLCAPRLDELMPIRAAVGTRPTMAAVIIGKDVAPQVGLRVEFDPRRGDRGIGTIAEV
eukprot:2884768-Rhodomonas_salina.2